MSTENNQCPDPFICPIMQDGEPMKFPVFEADGHTYERSGICRVADKPHHLPRDQGRAQ